MGYPSVPSASSDGPRGNAADSQVNEHTTIHALVSPPTAAEVALQYTRGLLDSILRHTDALVYAKDLDGKFVLANSALQDAVGRTEAELLGRTSHELFPTLAANLFRDNDLRIIASGEREVFDEEFLDPTGRRHYYRSTKFPLKDNSGQTFAVGGVSLNTTELSSLTKSLAESERRWRALVEASPSAITVVTHDGHFVYANTRAATLFGLAEATALDGRHAGEFVAAGDREAAASWFAGVLRNDPDQTGQRFVLRTKGAISATVECYASTLTFSGRPAVQIEIRDITVRTAALVELEQSERRFRDIFAHSPVAMALSDERGLWVELNAAMGQLVGYPVESLVGRSALDHVHHDDKTLVARSEQGQLDSADGVLRMEIRFVQPGGSHRWAWFHITPTPGPRGEKWTLAIAQDITERKSAETALRESEEDLAAIAAVARCVQTGGNFRAVVVNSLMTLSGAATASLLECPDRANLVVTASAGIDAVGMSISLADRSVNAQVWRTGRPVFLPDAKENPAVNATLLALDGTVSALWHPIVVDGVVLAVLNATWRQRMPGLSHRAVRAALMIADEAGASLNADALRIELEKAATTDPLTGALNRRAWESRIVALMNDLRSTTDTFVVALVDLDFFKQYNDSLGHTAGDLVLRDFSANVDVCVPDGSFFARWGGEEFILALRDHRPDRVQDVLRRIQSEVPAGLTCSVGYTTWLAPEPIESCISRADAALYEAKRLGRNQIAGH